jgi:hypothetical protein
MAPKTKDKKGAKGAKKPAATKASAGERDPKTMTFEEREEVWEALSMLGFATQPRSLLS